MRCRRECTRSIGLECEISGLMWLADEETLRETFRLQVHWNGKMHYTGVKPTEVATVQLLLCA